MMGAIAAPFGTMVNLQLLVPLNSIDIHMGLFSGNLQMVSHMKNILDNVSQQMISASQLFSDRSNRLWTNQPYTNLKTQNMFLMLSGVAS